MRLLPALLLPLSITLAAQSHALAPGQRERGFEEGANHHVGDRSFVEAFGRPPNAGDGEALRMHTHFVHVRRWLASRDATKPELADKRREILGYFDEYIAKGTTPQNAHVPWRTPVFIDDHGTICAVGYLIEKTAGRPLAEKIAKEHRYNVLEDIAAATPEVRAWIEASGFTIEELASIQPGYTPIVRWNEQDFSASTPAAEGAARGPFKDKKPHGPWRFYHASGNLAAHGSFVDGHRDGEWTFYYDKKERTRMAVGSFSGGTPIDEWNHYDTSGALVARARPESPRSFRGAGYLVNVVAHAGETKHWSHQGFVAGTRHRLDFLVDGTERIYVEDGAAVHDAAGNQLSRDAHGWVSRTCDWNRVRKASAASGDLVTLHGLVLAEKSTCTSPTPIPDARGRHLDAMLASLAKNDPARVVATNMSAVVALPKLGSVDAVATR